MKSIIRFLLVILLASGMSFLSLAVTSVPAAYAAEGEEKAPSGPHPDFEYMQLDPLQLPIITTRGLTQEVSLMVSLEVNYGDKDTLSIYKPRLADAYLQDLYGALGAGAGLMRGNLIDVQKIKARLTSVTDKVLGPDHKVREVLLQVVQQHQM